MIIQAYGKINLGIDVLNKRDDGYHNIDIVSIPLELHDSIEVYEIPSSNQTYITSDDPTLLCDENNLAYKALSVIKKHYDFKRSYRIHIFKRIPSEAGLGGGSADAGAVIRVLCKLLKINPESEEILQLAAQVGSDVPFSVLNKPTRLKGMGEQLLPIDLKKSYYVLLVKPNKGLSTKLVFDEFDAGKYTSNHDLTELVETLESKEKQLTNSLLYNALEKPAINLCKDVEIVLNKMKELGLDLYGMSGSGSCCYALSEDKEFLEKIQKEFPENLYMTYVTSFRNHKKFLAEQKKEAKRLEKAQRKLDKKAH